MKYNWFKYDKKILCKKLVRLLSKAAKKYWTRSRRRANKQYIRDEIGQYF
jgi:hypothetical protein